MPEEGQKQMDRNHRKESDKRAEIREESRINGLKPARKEVWTEKKKTKPQEESWTNWEKPEASRTKILKPEKRSGQDGINASEKGV